MILDKKNHNEIILVCFTLFFLKLPLFYPIKVLTLNGFIGASYGKILLVFNVLILLTVFTLSITNYKKIKIKKNDIMFFLFFIFIIIGACLITLVNTGGGLNWFVDIIKNTYIPLLLILFVNDKDKIFKSCLYFSRFISLVLIINFKLSLLPDTNYMEYGFSLALCLLFIAVNIFYLRSYLKTDFILFVVGFVILFLFGGRGALLAILLTSYFLYLISPSFKKNNKIVISLSLFFVFIFIYIYFYEILRILYEIITSNGYESRTLKYLLYNSNSVDSVMSGRDELYNISLNIINNNNFSPMGFSIFKNITGDKYPHNIFLEMFINFGYLSFLIILLFILIVVVFSKVKVKLEIKGMVFGLLLYSFFKLSLSSTYWLELPFWLSIYFMFNFVIKKKV